MDDARRVAMDQLVAVVEVDKLIGWYWLSGDVLVHGGPLVAID